jgi:poly(A) polymerase
VRFAAKLGFELDPATASPIPTMAPLLANVPLSRLFDEMFKLMQTGHALASVEQLRKFGLIGGKLSVFPVLDAALAPATPNPVREKFVRMALEDTDRRVAEDRAVAPSFMLACMLWHDVLDRWAVLRASGGASFPALQQAVDAVFDARIGDISGRGKLAADMREIWLMQPRFERRTPSSAQTLVSQPRFRAGYDFLRLRADCGELSAELADWWEDFHLGSDDEREALLRDIKPAPQRVRRAPALSGQADDELASRTSPASVADELSETPETDTAEAPDTEVAGVPRKRRRRRRRPAVNGQPTAPTPTE